MMNGTITNTNTKSLEAEEREIIQSIVGKCCELSPDGLRLVYSYVRGQADAYIMYRQLLAERETASATVGGDNA